MILTLHVAPHREEGGHHRDKFDAYLGGELIHTGKQIIRPAARKLLERGYDPQTLLTMFAEGASGASFRPRTIAEWGGEMLVEADRDGFQIKKWTDPALFRNGRSDPTPPPENAQDDLGAVDDTEEAA